MSFVERLRRFFYSDDPILKVAAGLSEPEAEMWRELLQNNGVQAMTKNMGGGLAYNWGRATTFANDYDIFVKRSDVGRARDLLTPLLSPARLATEDMEAYATSEEGEGPLLKRERGD
ncbi:MAG: hypothetical protein WBD55_02915 [Dehalococcoidia bacterium]